LKYVEICKAEGDRVESVSGLANYLWKTGNADSFIEIKLYPERLEKDYGEAREFSDEPCKVCFGAKMANTDGKGYRRCKHCRNEKGQATGYEPMET
jgi:hypothetical protein